MVWIVQPRELKQQDGSPSGLWHLTANSDEGGGFVAGCDHDHRDAESAQECPVAKEYLAMVTGFPSDVMDKAYPGDAKPGDPIKAVGVGRDAGHEKSLILYLSRRPTDDEMRAIGDIMRGALARR